MIKRKIFLTFIFASLALPVLSQDVAQTRFDQANKAFEEGNLPEVKRIYEDLSQQGFSGAALFYNMGNLYYRLGNRGKAILWYERAARLSPRDNDIEFNLSLARSHIKGAEPRFFEKITQSVSTKELTWLLALSLWVFFLTLGSLLIGWIQSEAWNNVVLWTSGLFLLIAGTWLGFNLSWQSKPWAVLVSPPGEVRNGPGLDYAVGFTIPEGSKVLVLNKRPKWTQVGAPQEGLKGWIQTNELEEI